MIELKNITRAYELGGEEILAINNISLTIKDGDFIVVIGPSGSGKSTLANIIGGLDTPDKGQVLIDNKDIAKLSDRKLSQYRNKKVGFIFQAFNLQPTLTALENVMIPLMFAKVAYSARRKRSIECLRAVGLEDRMKHRPNQLSGGQRQRVCIARALANQPSMIIADEPTGNLDSAKGAEIIALLKKLNEDSGLTLLIITHDPTVAQQARRVLTMKDGKIIRKS